MFKYVQLIKNMEKQALIRNYAKIYTFKFHSWIGSVIKLGKISSLFGTINKKYVYGTSSQPW